MAKRKAKADKAPKIDEADKAPKIDEADGNPGGTTDELETIDEAAAKGAPGDCAYCSRPILVAPYYRSGNDLFCCQDCRNEKRRNAGLSVVGVEGDGERPRVGRGFPVDRAEVIWSPVRCPSCGSEQRQKFTGNPRRVETGGRSPISGETYNVVMFRKTKCKDCGQPISAKSYEWDADLDDAKYPLA
jgi:DNA-directed RNA polymerase subunit N (RpoN/RPB10)